MSTRSTKSMDGDIFDIDPVRLSAIDVIENYIINLQFSEDSKYYKTGLTNEEIERFSRMKWCLKELVKLITIVDEPPLIIIERYGRKLKYYSKHNPDFLDCLPAIEMIIQTLGG